MSGLGPYELDNVYCCDCIDGISQLPDESVDLWLTSPPYGNLRTYNGYTFLFEAVALGLWRITKPGGVGVWVVADETKDGSESGTSFRQALGFMEWGFKLHDTMIYDKNGFRYPFPDKYHQVWEYMFIFSKGKPNTVNLLEDRPIIYNNHVAPLKREADGSLTRRSGYKNDRMHGKRFNIWQYSAGGSKSTLDKFAYDHPAIFPEALARDHIISWSNPGDVVLDIFAGSGTTLKMAKELGRRFLGFDISQEYVDLAKRRIEAAKVPLFVPGENGKIEPVQLGFMEAK